MRRMVRGAESSSRAQQIMRDAGKELALVYKRGDPGAASDEESSSSSLKMPEDLRFLAEVLEYDPKLGSKTRMPWRPVLVGAILCGLYLWALLSSLKMRGDINGLNAFFAGLAAVGANSIRASAGEIVHRAGSVELQLRVVRGVTAGLSANLTDFTLRLPDVRLHERELVDSSLDSVYVTARPTIDKINGTLVYIQRSVHSVTEALVALSLILQKNIIGFRAAFSDQLGELQKVLEAGLPTEIQYWGEQATRLLLKAEAAVKGVLTPLEQAGALPPDVDEHLLDQLIGSSSCLAPAASGGVASLQGAVNSTHLDISSVQATAGRTVAAGIGDLNSRVAGVLSAPKVDAEQLQKLAVNLTHGLLRLPERFEGLANQTLAELREKTALLQAIDAHLAAALSDLDSLAGNRRGFRDEAVDVITPDVREARLVIVRSMGKDIDAALDQLQHVVRVAAAPLIAVVDKLRSMCVVAVSLGERLNSTADAVEASPKSLAPLVTSVFSARRVEETLIVTACGLLVAGCTAWWGVHVRKYEDDLEALALQDKDALKLLCSFHRNVSELDVTLMDSLVRPAQRLWMHTVFVVRYARTLVFGLIILLVLQIAVLMKTVHVLFQVILVWVAASSAGDSCNDPGLKVLSSEEDCSRVVSDLSAIMQVATVLPSRNCLDSHLLLCSDFFWPLSFWSGSLAYMLGLSILCLLYLALTMPWEIKGCFESLAYTVVEEHLASPDMSAGTNGSSASCKSGDSSCDE